MAINLLMDFWLDDDIHVFNWSSLTRRIVFFLMGRPGLLRRQDSCRSLQPEWTSIEAQRGCHSIAFGTWGPRRLASVLDAMQSFECADLRDKFYGILSLVDWRSNVPTPDYGKTCFDIAVEILRIYLDQEACSPLAKEIIDWPEQLCSVFDLSCHDNALRDALRVRCPQSVMPLALIDHHMSLQVDILFPRGLQRFQTRIAAHSPLGSKIFWFGVRLRGAEGLKNKLPSGSREDLYYAAPVGEQRLGRVLNHDGQLLAYVPSFTQVDDWFVSPKERYQSSSRPLSIIARPPKHNKGKDYAIIGQASVSAGATPRFPPYHGLVRFLVHWNAEDLLLLYWTRAVRTSCPREGDILADCLDVRICGSEGSSYARMQCEMPSS
jgi:hypothetical protein